jgi:microcystin-dependent protein
MAFPFVGEIQVFANSFVPNGWAICDGSILQVRQNTPLFSLIGSTYGGNGTTTFALPNLVGCVAISQGQGPGLSNYPIGASVGSATASVSQQEMPAHVHPMQLGIRTSTNSTAAPSATSNVAIDPNFNGFVAPPANTTFATSAIVPNGGSQPHPNAQPTLGMVYCIALQGDFPSFG